jgi:shikimate kinase
VGRQLARALRCPFQDVDAEIERQIGTSIRRFFEAEGEAAFRDMEQTTLSQLLDQGSCVLATGGGAVLRDQNRSKLREQSVVVYLRSTPEELFRRLRHDVHRPLLQVKDPLQKLRELYEERDPLYRATARFVIETGRPSVASLVNMILMQLELANLVDADRVPSPVAPKSTPPTT